MNDNQPRYPIGVVAQRTGLSPHVIRAWERRYAAVDPARTEGGDRLYSAADLLRLRLLARLSEAGHPIGRVARLATPELVALLPEEGEPSPAPSPPRPAHRFVEAALECVEVMDAVCVRGILTRAVVALSAEEFIEEVALPLLRRVGDLWEEGRLCPAHEHMLSAQLAWVLGWMMEASPPAAGAPDAVAATPAGQRHEFGALLASLVAAQEGWRVTYLGTDLPAGDIARAVQARGAGVVLLSAALEASPGPLLAEIRALREAAGPAVRILVGGRGAAASREQVVRAEAEWLPDYGALRDVLRSHRPGGRR